MGDTGDGFQNGRKRFNPWPHERFFNSLVFATVAHGALSAWHSRYASECPKVERYRRRVATYSICKEHCTQSQL